MPVSVLKLAQLGLLLMLKPRASPSASLAVGVKLYVLPAVIDVRDEPEMVGEALVAPVTVMLKAASEALDLPSLTLILMFE